MTEDPSAVAMRQLRLRYRLSAQTADTYAAAGFTVVLQDAVIGPELAEMVELISSRPLRTVVLAPRPEVIADREAARRKSGYGSVTETVDEILRRAEAPG